MDEAEVRSNWWQRRNWWKIGFFVMLVLFEFARETAVLERAPEAKIATSAFVGGDAGYAMATGRWVRLDGGGSMVPTSVKIECSSDTGQCMEITTHIIDGYVGQPFLETFEAKFEPDAVSYENDNPDCARYAVRIDLKVKKVIALRERQANPKNEICRKLERRIEMTLSDGYQESKNPYEGHFVPIYSGISGIIKMF